MQVDDEGGPVEATVTTDTTPTTESHTHSNSCSAMVSFRFATLQDQ